jgi:hypothetical protein
LLRRRFDGAAAFFNVGSALFALLAAGLWFWSTTPKLPADDEFQDTYDSVDPAFLRMVKALRDQSLRNAWGARCAAVAALLQVGAAFWR